MNISMFLMEFNELNNEIQLDPLTYEEAIKRSNRDCWVKAMNDEINSLKKHGTWEIGKPPQGANVISTRFVFKIKCLADNSIEKYKARLVVQGFAQKDGIDFWSDDLFALTSRLTTICCRHSTASECGCMQVKCETWGEDRKLSCWGRRVTKRL